VNVEGSLVLRASSFELERSQSDDVSGNFELGAADEIAYETLMNLCSQPDVDKIIIVYKDYEFCLMGVSLHGENISPRSIALRKSKFLFSAKDIKLESLS